METKIKLLGSTPEARVPQPPLGLFPHHSLEPRCQDYCFQAVRSLSKWA